MLWFGWFGFNAGSALGATADAVLAFANTNIASATAMITWMFYERFQNRKMSAVGACIGAIVGLVAITPAAGFVTPGESLVIGGLTALLCNAAMSYQRKTRVDDTLEVFPSHGVGGMIGMVMTALFAGEVGLLHGGGWTAFGVHLLALVGTAAFAFGGAYGLFVLVNAGLSMRVTEAQEERGLDLSQHGESLS
jgi:Amt family ammonium transporter